MPTEAYESEHFKHFLYHIISLSVITPHNWDTIYYVLLSCVPCIPCRIYYKKKKMEQGIIHNY